MIVGLNEYDIRYLLSCLEGDIIIFKDLNHFRNYLSTIGRKKENSIEVDWNKIRALFPNLEKNLISKYKEEKYLPPGTISNYFEDVSKCSHNFFIIKQILDFKELESFADCLVLVGRKEGEIYHFYTLFGDVFEEQVYFGYFTPSEIVEKDRGEYFTVHRRKNGKGIAIRIIDENKAKEMIEYLYSFNIQK